MAFLETSVKLWREALPLGSTLVVTVDGSAEDAERVRQVVDEPGPRVGGNTYRVGRPAYPGDMDNQHRLGVAVNKNTGIELLMDSGVEHLFLSDDDCGPLYPEALDKHVYFGYQHSMVCWGKSRLIQSHKHPAIWSWPRGVMLYMHRAVIRQVGGMDERFGFPGGHEHAEYSRRIHQHGLTPAPFISPHSYATRNGRGATVLWHCEDMRKGGEVLESLGARRDSITSINKAERDWDNIHSVMASRDGDTSFVPYAAHENGRASAILCSDLTSRGADK